MRTVQSREEGGKGKGKDWGWEIPTSAKEAIDRRFEIWAESDLHPAQLALEIFLVDGVESAFTVRAASSIATYTCSVEKRGGLRHTRCHNASFEVGRQREGTGMPGGPDRATALFHLGESALQRSTAATYGIHSTQDTAQHQLFWLSEAVSSKSALWTLTQEQMRPKARALSCKTCPAHD